MKVQISIKSTGKRLTIVCEEEPPKSIPVKGHFRMINGKRTYVKAHRRRR